jgi:hypothetical protein
VEELEEQVAYLKAFGQAVRVQLRSYLEALITDVEAEWGRADPAAVPQGPPRPPTPRANRDTADEGGATAFAGNTVSEVPHAEGDVTVAAGARSSS